MAGYSLALPPRDSAGWTVLPTGGTTKYFSQGGNDSTGDGSLATPYKTVAKLKTLLTTGQQFTALFKCGEVWPEVFSHWLWSGASRTAPIVLASYGVGARPRFNCGANDFFVIQGGGGSPASINHVWLIGLDAYSDIRDPASASYNASDTTYTTGYTLELPAADLQIEDCRFRFFSLGVNINPQQLAVSDIRFWRSHLLDSWFTSGQHSQGIYTGPVTDWYFQENLVDHNGYNETAPGAIKTNFNHGVYNTDCNKASVQNNLATRNSSFGLSLSGYTGDTNPFTYDDFDSSGNVIAGNSNSHNLTCVGVGHITNGSCHGNLIEENGGDIGGVRNSFGISIGSGVNLQVYGNLYANNPASTNNGALEVANQTQTGVSFTGNTIYNWPATPVLHDQSGQVTLSGNSVLTTNSPRTLQTYDTSLGGPGTLAHLMGLVRGQSKQSWDNRLTAQSMLSYITNGNIQPAPLPTPTQDESWRLQRTRNPYMRRMALSVADPAVSFNGTALARQLLPLLPTPGGSTAWSWADTGPTCTIGGVVGLTGGLNAAVGALAVIMASQKPAGSVDLGSVVSKSVGGSGNERTWTHIHQNGVVVYTGLVSGETIVVTALVTNTTATGVIPAVRFSGWTAHFDATPFCYGQQQGDSWYVLSQNDGLNVLYPNANQNPVGIATAHDNNNSLGHGRSYGFGALSNYRQSWSWTGAPTTSGSPQLIADLGNLQPGQSRAVTFCVTATSTLTYKYTNTAYKTWYNQIAYKNPLFIHDNRSWIDAPGGLASSGQGGTYRLLRRYDSNSGIAALIAGTGGAGSKAGMVASGFQSVIYQSFIGWTAVQVDPAFDNFPPGLLPFAQSYVNQMEPDVRVGCSTHPSVRVVGSGFANLDPITSDQLETLHNAFNFTQAMGITDYYMDEFGLYPFHTNIMQQVRGWVGPYTQGWTEYQHCESMPLFGGYKDSAFVSTGSYTYSSSYQFEMDLMEWLDPKRTLGILLPPGRTNPQKLEDLEYWGQHRYTPIQHDYDYYQGGTIAFHTRFIDPATSEWLDSPIGSPLG